jgi:hypothetical protein
MGTISGSGKYISFSFPISTSTYNVYSNILIAARLRLCCDAVKFRPRHSLIHAVVWFQRNWCRSNPAQTGTEYTYGLLHYTYYTEQRAAETRNRTYSNPIDRSTAVQPTIIAEQYSSTTYASLCFQSCKQKYGAHFKNCYFSIHLYYFKNALRMKLCNLEERKSGNVFALSRS